VECFRNHWRDAYKQNRYLQLKKNTLRYIIIGNKKTSRTSGEKFPCVIGMDLQDQKTRL